MTLLPCSAGPCGGRLAHPRACAGSTASPRQALGLQQGGARRGVQNVCLGLVMHSSDQSDCSALSCSALMSPLLQPITGL